MDPKRYTNALSGQDVWLIGSMSKLLKNELLKKIIRPTLLGKMVENNQKC
jgi:hypothetical protein